MPLLAQKEFQEKVPGQLDEELGFQENEDTDDGSTMEQKSPERDGIPSEQEVGAEQGHRYLTRERKAPIRFTIISCVRLHDSDGPLIKDARKESESAQSNAAVNKQISAPEDMQYWTLAKRLTHRRGEMQANGQSDKHRRKKRGSSQRGTNIDRGARTAPQHRR